ncbi:MAG TPA: aldo/keto reductase [Aggregatilineales bacterium]|nr:aldo/keto reductase [Anaerolineales bacterium]HRE46795.1 aldo/keto reductase [Aggregatilineales bacterium]
MATKSLPKHPFGRTGHHSSQLIFGAVALDKATPAEAAQTLALLFEYGINHIDTAASYGTSEDKLKPWLKDHRDQFFLATKTGIRTYEGAKESLHRSLERMGVSSVDLIQLHYLVNPDEWTTAMSSNGALEALIEAREQGLTRFIGVTGHDVAITAMHMRSMEHFAFDSILLPYNWILMQNPTYAAGFESLLALCAERGTAVQTIKAIARGAWGANGQQGPTWYEPFTDQAAIDAAVQWVIGRPEVFLNTVGDVRLLPKVLDAAARFERRPSDEAMREAMAEGTPLFV